MGSKVQKQEQQMPVYWENNIGGLQAKDSDMEVENEDYEIQKPQIQRNEKEEQMKDLMVNKISILELQMTKNSVSNNCKSEGFGMQGSEDDLSRVLTKSIKVFT